MRTVRQWYEKYRIMPQLEKHQLRVAAVAHMIMKAFDASAVLHKDEVISACLLHDMGNILKFDLAYFPEFLEPQGAAYWEVVKADFLKKYGSDEHDATLKIIDEIGVSARTKEYVDAIGFRNADEALRSDSFEKKICCYADQRVAPRSVVSLAERWEEGSRRYAGRSMRENDRAYAERQISALEETERRIFSCASIAPNAITEEECERYFPLLEDFAIV